MMLDREKYTDKYKIISWMCKQYLLETLYLLLAKLQSIVVDKSLNEIMLHLANFYINIIPYQMSLGARNLEHLKN